MELLQIGWRNLRRNTRRTVLNVVALALGTAIMIVSVAWVRGYFTGFFQGIINLDTGNAQVLPGGYLAEQRRLPLDLTVDSYTDLKSQLLAQKTVEAVAGRIAFAAELGDGSRSTHMLGRAIEPAEEAKITVVSDHIQRGSYLSAGEHGVLLSESVALRLGVNPGDPIFITAIDATGGENFIETVLTGTFSLGYPEIDNSMFYIDLTSAQELLGMNGKVSTLVLKLDSGPNMGDLLDRIRAAVPRLSAGTGDATGSAASGTAAGGAAGTDALELYGWRTFAQTIVDAVQGDISGFSFIIVILFGLVIIGILNSMSMAVQERRREIGTLRAIGIKRAQLTRFFLSEGLSIALIGAVAGCVLAGLAGLYLGLVGVDMSALAGMGIPIPFGNRFTADFRVWDFLLGAAISSITAIIGTIFPTRRAARLSIAGALGSHLE